LDPTHLRNWVKQLSDDPQHAFPGYGQMKLEQLEIAQLKREVAKLKAERDIPLRRNRREVRFCCEAWRVWPGGLVVPRRSVSRGGFYASLTRPRSRRSRSDEGLGAKVRTSFLASDQYGARDERLPSVTLGRHSTSRFS
jgi:hypothetical protein